MAAADEPEIKLARKVVERLELKDFTVRDYENPGTGRRAAPHPASPPRR